MYGSTHIGAAVATAGTPVACATLYTAAFTLWHIVTILTVLSALAALWRLTPRTNSSAR